MNFKKLLLYSFLLAVTAYACGPDDEPDGPKPRYEEYFPLQPGAWRIYQVDSFARPTPTNEIVKGHYQVKEVIDSAFLDGSGKKMYKILRYRRANDQDAWALVQVLAAGIQGNEAIWQEGNSRYVKMVFPLSEGKMWNANLYNNEDSAGYYHSKIVALHKQATVKDSTGGGQLSFDSTALIELNNESTAIYTDYNIERYARGVGLVESQHDSVTTQAKSFWIRKRIVSFGK